MHVLCTVGAPRPCLFFFFFNDTATTEIYTLSLHDALPIYLQLSLDLREELGDERRIPSGQVALAQAHLSAGNHDQAVELLRQAVAGARTAGLLAQRIEDAEQALQEAEAGSPPPPG